MKKINRLFTSIITLVFLMSISTCVQAQRDQRRFISNQSLDIGNDSVTIMPGGYSLSFTGLQFSFLGKKNIFLIKSIRFNYIDGRSFIYDSLNFKAVPYGSLVVELPSEIVLNAGKLSQVIVKYNTINPIATEKNIIQIFATNLIKQSERLDVTGFEPGYISAESGRYESTQINQIYPRN